MLLNNHALIGIHKQRLKCDRLHAYSLGAHSQSGCSQKLRYPVGYPAQLSKIETKRISINSTMKDTNCLKGDSVRTGRFELKTSN
ncbi:hypothetical protein HZ326_7547 [Fusarium oxysporum f. sp. albedinis]|nr:hypothetical protein HZ326_7547 [Fusarium oxysporum f. sp. albedinis]